MPKYLMIQIASLTPPGLADELADDLGVYPHIESDSGRAIDAAAVEVVISAAAGTFFGSIAQQFGTRAADQLCQGFGRLVKLARHTTSNNPAPQAIFIDEATGVRCALDPETVSDSRAMQALLTLDYSTYHPGATIRWDPQSIQWTPNPPMQQSDSTQEKA